MLTVSLKKNGVNSPGPARFINQLSLLILAGNQFSVVKWNKWL